MALYIGLMSGTSVDSIDAALLNFEHNTPQLIATHSHTMPAVVRTKLLELNQSPHIELTQLGQLDHQLGLLFASTAETLIEQAAVRRADIHAIGSHGQTIFHMPHGPHPFTMQIGDANIIAEKTGITTVADLRRRDMAAGGQGAPLVPAFHADAFRSPNTNRAIVNIGGIANISYLPSSSTAPCLGFDTGPGNGLLDAWTAHHQGVDIDRDGGWGKSGQLNPALLATLMNDDYFKQPPPKSTGRDYFNENWLNHKLSAFDGNNAACDIQATLHHLTARSIAEAIDTHAAASKEIYVCGGGAHNTYLMDCLRQYCGDRSIDTTLALGIAPDWVEAAAFAWLAKQTLDHKPGNMPSVTGAHHPVVLGAIYPA